MMDKTILFICSSNKRTKRLKHSLHIQSIKKWISDAATADWCWHAKYLLKILKNDISQNFSSYVHPSDWSYLTDTPA
jgi:hypothetical protein